MNISTTRLSNTQKIVIICSLVFFLAALVFQLFFQKVRQAEIYDELGARLSTIRFSIAKLEYELDIFIVSRQFESTSIDLIKRDVDSLNQSIEEIPGNSNYKTLLGGNALLYDGINSITEDWHNINIEIARLDDALNADEVMLIHNTVDIHTVLVGEKTDRLLGMLSEGRQAVFNDIRSLIVKSILGFALLILSISILYYRKIISPLGRASTVAHSFADGDFKARFNDDPSSLIGRLGEDLNRMLGSLSDKYDKLAASNSSLAEQIENGKQRIKSVSNILSIAGSSVLQRDILDIALKEAIPGSCAEAGVLLLAEGGNLKLKALAGFGPGAPKDVDITGAEKLKDIMKSASPRLFTDIREFPDSSIGEFLKSCGFQSLLCLPILFNNETLGLMLLLCKKAVKDEGPALPFLEAITSSLSLSIGQTRLFQNEHNSRRFVENVIRQLPFGVAVFDKDGRCVVINNALKKMLGAGKTDIAPYYRISEDEVLTSRGLLDSVNKAYEGYVTEFIINYDPAFITRYSLSGPPRRLRIKSLPLYDAGGDVSNIMLIYEDLSDRPVAPEGKGEPFPE